MSEPPRKKIADVPLVEDVRGLKVKPGQTPANLAAVERMHAGRIKAMATMKERRAAKAALLEADPLAHLQQFRRAEWKISELYLADPKVDLKHLAATLGYSDWRTVQQTLKKPRVQKFIAQVRMKTVEAIIHGDFGAQALLKQSQTKAAQKVVETIDSPTAGAKVNLAAAESVLDRTGLGKSSAVQHHHVHEILRHFTPEELDQYGNHGLVPPRFATVFAQLEGPKE